MKYNVLVRLGWLSFLLILGGCSIAGSDKTLNPQTSNSVLVPSRAVIHSRPIIIASVTKAPPHRKPIRIVKPYKPEVKRYRESQPVVQVLTDKEQAAFDKAMIQLEKKRREVDDPYASIPDNSSSSSQAQTRKPIAQRKSSAVSSLILQAHAEMMVGKYLTAESKIERGLRIEPENPKLWSLLAKTHYGQSNYSQAINMSRKAIQFSRDDDLTAKSWRLIKKAGEKSGDTFAIKDANNYIKMNP